MLLIFQTVACSKEKKDYGVFIGLEPESLEQLFDYKKVVIDASYYSEEDIRRLHQHGVKVYSYLNIGSLEEFRDFYAEFEHLVIGDYKNWDDEQWVDVSDEGWQRNIDLQAQDFVQKGVDGFFLDNADVYYHFPDEKIFQGLLSIFANLNRLEKELMVNGGDFFVTKALLEEQNPSIRIDAVNQECVFTNIDFEKKELILQEEETSDYYKEYLQKCKRKNIEIYLTEYAKDKSGEKQIAEYCKQHGYEYFISESINLDDAR
ncbi:MAG: endo alpha-1,4 polygalactosaminidase [Peptostreptococcaceae bacterium]|nr:endo alpha-1,4 polygalactosaminidase [Peptostreptococcaceae bacterium]